MRSLCAPALAAVVILCAAAASAADPQVERGKYLVTIASCNDCHTPGYFLGQTRLFSHARGSEVGFTIPGLGAFVGRNLTPDKETGLGNWTDDQIISAMTAGIRRMAAGLPRSCHGRGYRISPRRRARYRRLSEKPSAGEERRPRTFRAEGRRRDAGVHHRSGRSVFEAARAAVSRSRRWSGEASRTRPRTKRAPRAPLSHKPKAR